MDTERSITPVCNRLAAMLNEKQKVGLEIMLEKGYDLLAILEEADRQFGCTDLRYWMIASFLEVHVPCPEKGHL